MGDVRLAGVTVVLDGVPVLVGVDAVVPDGAFAAVIGPSGSGKSTLLRAIAGLVRVAAGTVEIGGRDVTRATPRERDIGMVFQMPALLPRRNVRRNVAFPLELRRETVESIRRRVDAETRAMHIEHLLLRAPDTLSRGEQQLVQIARTMVRTPGLLLLDEPFAPLDAHRRATMRSEIAMLQRGYGVTTVMATNDPDDMSTLADHLVVLGHVDDESGGADTGFTVVQSGTPADLVDEPISLEVGSAVAPLWRFDARVEAGSPGSWLAIVDGAGNRTGGRMRAWSPVLDAWVGRNVTVGFRSGDLAVREHGTIEAVADRLVPGAPEPLLCRIAGRAAQCALGEFAVSTIGERPSVRLEARRALVFDPATGRRIA